MKKKVLINASNMHVAGSKQFAVSSIYELSKLKVNKISLDVLSSSEVNTELKSTDIDFKNFSSYEVFDAIGLKVLFSGLNAKFKKYDLVFTIMGPPYFFKKNTFHISGFAQAQIIYGTGKHTWADKSSLLEKLLDSFKYFLKKLAFKRMDRLFVELEHVKKGLIDNKIFPEDKIDIIYNSVSSIYFDESQWRELVFQKEEGIHYLGIVSRDYRHKNLKILPEVQRLLCNEYAIPTKFVVTLDNEEWVKNDSLFKKNILNVGPLSINECPTFYKMLDGVIFPSLLESFSITPIEALVMEKPLFASDLPFVRDCCGNFANYFNPNTADSIASVIANYFNNINEGNFNRLAEGRKHALALSSPTKRAEDFLKLIEKNL